MSSENWLQLNLPEFMFLEWSNHEENDLNEQRAVIFHVPSGSIIEIVEENPKLTAIAQNRLVFRFGYVDPDGDRYSLWAVLMRCPGRDMLREREPLIETLVKPACKWYCEDLDFYNEDEEEDDDDDGFDY